MSSRAPALRCPARNQLPNDSRAEVSSASPQCRLACGADISHAGEFARYTGLRADSDIVAAMADYREAGSSAPSELVTVPAGLTLTFVVCAGGAGGIARNATVAYAK